MEQGAAATLTCCFCHTKGLLIPQTLARQRDLPCILSQGAKAVPGEVTSSPLTACWGLAHFDLILSKLQSLSQSLTNTVTMYLLEETPRVTWSRKHIPLWVLKP